MNAREVIETISNGGCVFGAQFMSTTPMLVPLTKKMNLDVMFLDLEHIPMDREITSWMCRTFSALDVMPIMRVPEPNPSLVCQFLDAGAEGIIVPYIESADQVEKLVCAAKYRPIKGELVEKIRKGEFEPNERTKEFLNGDVWNCNPMNKLLLVNIESRAGINNLDEILSVPGLDGVMIGPQDLSISLGIPEDYLSAEFDEAVKYIAEKARSHGVFCGIHFAATVEQAVHFIKDYGIQLYLEVNELVAFARDVGTRLQNIRSGII